MPLFGQPNVEKMKGKGNIKGLINALGYEKDPHVSQEASLALLELGDMSVKPLIAALEHKETAVRQPAADILVKFGEKGITPLMAALKNWESRDAAVHALAKVREPEVQRLIEQLIAALMVDGDDIQGEIRVLIGFGSPTVEKLIAILGDKTLTIGKQKSNVMRLNPYAPKIFPYIVGLIQTHGGFHGETLNVRGFAAAALGRIGDARAFEPLTAALQDEDEFVRGTAAGALFMLGDERAVEPLMLYLRDDDLVATMTDGGMWEYLGDGRGVKVLLSARRSDEDPEKMRTTFELLGWGSRPEK